MTLRQLLEGVQIELTTHNTGVLLLEDFNYVSNKAVYQILNKNYNIYDINQQTTDNLRVLKSTAILTPALAYQNVSPARQAYLGAIYKVDLPKDYFHILNCVCHFKVKKDFHCFMKDSYWEQAANRITADQWAQVINNLYLRPSYKRPYYYIHNVNASVTLPTNSETDMVGVYKVTNTDGTGDGDKSNLPRTIQINGTSTSFVERDIANRYGNASPVRMEIRYGKDNTVFELIEVSVDYVKTPQYLLLTQEQLDLTEDTSQIMEFPDYICQEIINEVVKIILEQNANPRLQTFIPVNTSIATPTSQQTSQQNQ